MRGEKDPYHIPGLEELEKDLDDRVHKRAYEIWLEEGQPAAEDLKRAEGEITSLSESD